MKKNYKLLIFACILIIGILCFIFISNKDKEIEDTSEIDSNVQIDDNLEEGKFDNADNNTVDLNTTDNFIITDEGIYTLTGEYNKTITINSESNIKIILDNVKITSSNGPCIYVKNATNVYIELIGDNTLIDSSTYSGYDSDIDATIFSHDDLIISGTGKLNITANYKDAIASKDDLKIVSGTYVITSKDDAIRGKDSVIINDGNFTITSSGDGIKATDTTDTTKGYVLIEAGIFNITSTLDGIQAESKLLINGGTFAIKTGNGASISSTSSSWGYWGNSNSSTTESAKALKATSNILIKDATFDINSSDDAIHSNDNVGITSGTFNISSGDDGIHADTTLVIDGGTINITKSYEGLESSNITINNGTIKIVASDDGINVAGGNDSSSMMGRPGQNNFTSSSNSKLIINNGNLYINSTGDGLDSNGSIEINNGEIIVDGPTDNGNGYLDYDSSFTMNGGTLIAAGSSGMAQNITGGSSYGVMINFSNYLTANTKITIDNVISYSPTKKFNSIVIVSPKFIKNETYTVKYGETTYGSFTINSTTTTVGNASSQMGGGMRR